MNNQQRNWLHLFEEYTTSPTTWHALTTAYTPELEIIRSRKYTRAFTTNSDRSIIYHKNTYPLPDNQTKEQSWEMKQEESNLSDGVYHPESENMRTIGFGNNTSIWVSKQFIKDKMFGSEVFFKQGDWRYSIIPVYEAGKLNRIVLIKENKQDFPSNVEDIKIEALSGKWQLTATEIKPDLSMSIESFSDREIQLDAISEDNKTWFLPEKVFISLPETIIEERNLTMIVGKQITDNCYKQIQIEYDTDGKLSNLISEVYQLEN